MPRSAWSKNPKKRVVKHLKSDIKTFKHEAEEDRELIHSLKKQPKAHHSKKQSPKAKSFISKRMHEFKEGHMHSRVKKTGPLVTNPKQAIAISLSEAREKGMKVSKKKK